MADLTDWQAHCAHEIANGLLEYEAQQLCLGEKVEVNKCKAWISKHKYPFGMRCNHPYKVWCQEMQILDVFFSTGIACKSYQMWRQAYRKPRKPNDYNEKRKVTYNPDQLSLF